MVGNSDRVLGESGIFIGVGIRGGAAEVLQIVVRDFVSVGAQRRELEPRFHRLKRKRIYLERIEEIFAALLARKKIVDLGEQAITAELPGIARTVVTESFGQMQAVLARLPRQQVGAPNAVHDGWNLDQHVAGVGVGLLPVARELGAEMADPTLRETGRQRKRRGFGGDNLLAIVAVSVI